MAPFFFADVTQPLTQLFAGTATYVHCCYLCPSASIFPCSLSLSLIMSQPGHLSVRKGDDGLTLLKLAEKIPQDVFPALKSAAASALYITATAAV